MTVYSFCILALLWASTLVIETKSEYKTTKYDFEEGRKVCLQKDCELPKLVSAEDFRGLSEFLLRKNLSAAWTGWKLLQLDQWTWINRAKNTIVINHQRRGRDNQTFCGSLDTTDEGLFRDFCQLRLGYICQFQDKQRHCDMAENHCMNYGRTTFVAYPTAKDWFRASVACENEGGTLAILDTQTKINLMLRLLRKLPAFQNIHQLYIGLRLESYTIEGRSQDLFQLNHSFWAHGHPVFGQSCSIWELNQTDILKGKMESARCRNLHVTVCYCTRLGSYIISGIDNVEKSAQLTTETNEQLAQVSTERTRQDTSEGIAIWKIVLPIVCVLVLTAVICVVIFTNKRFHSRDEAKDPEETRPLNEMKERRRQTDHALSLDRVSLLSKHKQLLIQAIPVDEVQEFGTRLLHKKSSERGVTVKEILKRLKTSTNKVYDEFCLTLFKANLKDIVGSCLTSEDDMISAKHKLADYFMEHFSKINLLKMDQKKPDEVAINNIYVQMSWQESTKNLDGLESVFKKIMGDSLNKKKNKRILIEGDAGKGKTTFVKRVCYLWADGYLEESERQSQSDLEEDTSCISSYSLVLPILLRSVKKDDKIEDILMDQLNLNIAECLSISKHLMKEPAQCIILLDGYDEFSSDCKFIPDLVKKDIHENVLCFTTSRPYGIRALTNMTVRTQDILFKLLGFNKEQMEKYFKRYLAYYIQQKSVDQSLEKLMKVLREERKELYEMAVTPIICEIISIVWCKKESLGETLADLYLVFIELMIAHYQNKVGNFSGDHSNRNVEDEKNNIIKEAARLANTWESNRLRILFDSSFIEDKLGSQMLKKLKATGLITVTYPTEKSSGNTEWSFPHLSVQEFLVAYHLQEISSDADINVFIKKCNNLKTFQRTNFIFRCMVSKHSDKVSEIMLYKIVRAERKLSEMEDVLEFLFSLCPYLNGVSVPLPRYVSTEWCEGKEEEFKQLLAMDKMDGLQNLHRLKIHDYKKFCGFIGKNYISELHVIMSENLTITKEETSVLKDMKKLQNLTLDIKELHETSHYHNVLPAMIGQQTQPRTTKGENIDRNVNSILSSVTPNLTTLSINSDLAAMDYGKVFKKFKKLENLFISEDQSETNQDRSYDYDSIKQFSKLKQLDIRTRFNEKLFLIQAESVILKLYPVFSHNLAETIKVLKTDVQSHVTHLAMRKTILSQCGELLAELICHLPILKTLDLRGSILEKQTMNKINEKLDKATKYPIQSLDLGENQLSGSGEELGNLVALMPNLETLNVDSCELSSSDLSVISAKKCKSKICTVRLHNNNFSFTPEERMVQVGPLSRLTALKVNQVEKENNLIRALCNNFQEGYLISLKILDLSDSTVKKGCLQCLGKHLCLLEDLSYLSLKNVDGKDTTKGEYESVFQNISSKDQLHLNVWSDYADISVDQIIKGIKKSLCKVIKLNVKLNEDDLNMVQDELEREYPDILIYSDSDEDLWDLFINDYEESGNEQEETQAPKRYY